MIKNKISLVILSVLLILQFCSCGNDKGENLSDVDMRNDLSVQITYRQISYNGTISFKNGTLYMKILNNDKFPDGLACIVDSTEITFCYDEIEKSFDCNGFDDNFMPKILYEFFSVCGETFRTEEVKIGEYSYIERNVCGKSVSFCVNKNNSTTPYTIIIK